MDLSRELVSTLLPPSMDKFFSSLVDPERPHAVISHEFQDAVADLERIAELVREEKEKASRPVLFITPEQELYKDVLQGEAVVPIDISRVANVIEWKTKGHRKHFPELSQEQKGAYKIFLDSVAFTGRSIEEVNRAYGIDIAVLELMGRHAPKKLDKLGIRAESARDISSFDAVWHLDDFVQPIRANGRNIKPSEFLETMYRSLQGLSSGSFLEEFKAQGIKTEQASPNLFLEMVRPGSYLGRSLNVRMEEYFGPNQGGKLPQVIELVKELESIYLGKGRE